MNCFSIMECCPLCRRFRRWPAYQACCARGDKHGRAREKEIPVSLSISSQAEPHTAPVPPGERLAKTTNPNKLLHTIGPALVLAAWDQAARGQTNDFNYTGSFTNWTVPATGLYHITAFGAQGGSADTRTNGGGFGAKIGGDFSLNSGQVLSIAVGGAGGNANFGAGIGPGGGGGGGSFVTSSGKALVIAGGGGGLGYGAHFRDGGDCGGTGTGGSAGFGTFSNGGSGGSGGTGGGYAGGGGGGGFLGNGGAGGYCGGGGGLGFAAGLTGGAGATFKIAPADRGSVGGFGGGGGSSTGGGGGGGFSGGGGGGFSSGGGGYEGGGGGSFNAGLNPIEVSGFRSGNGLVEIVFLSTVPTLDITNSAPGFVTISWAFASTNWLLQENLDLATTNWVNSPSGTTNPVTVPANQPAKYYRLLGQ